jgi:predicted TIM-barrel fold metal-dependent hydrolase
VPRSPVVDEAIRRARDACDRNARMLGLSRRSFLLSVCGAATTLLALNACSDESIRATKGRKPGGTFDIPTTASTDPDAARAALAGNEFVFDVQGHFVNPSGAWLKRLPKGAKPLGFATSREGCKVHEGPGDFDYLRCVGPDQFVKDVFMDSDTDLMVLSFVPSTHEGEPLTMQEAEATARIVEKLDGTHRLYIHGRVNPNQPGDLEGMDELASRHKIAAWKTYTQFGPGGKGFFLDDEPGLRMIEKARKLGIRNVAVHKGLPFGPKSYEHSTCADVGRVAKRFPDVNFLIYHSGFVTEKAEGPHDPRRTDGVDALVTSLMENAIRPNTNVYAELGSTWRFAMRDPDTAAHTLGKLLKHCGESNVLWGTDSIWYGSPQDQIQAFRAFQISAELRDKHGYPELTPALRARVFGLNGLKIYPIADEVLKKHLPRDRVATTRAAYREHPDPTFVTHGPRTRREFLNLKAWGS